jgi:hypothetical protein
MITDKELAIVCLTLALAGVGLAWLAGAFSY